MTSGPTKGGASRPLSLPQYQRYGRQMILPDVGLPGQLRLQAARVLVVGAGGLGCPAIQYLAAAGVGHLSIVDHDHVETSNLARQILHSDSKVGMNKARSAEQAAKVINPHVSVEVIEESFSAQTAVSLTRQHDLVLDCTDNVLARYLISDAAVVCGKQVVSGAAQGMEGQLVVLHKDIGTDASSSTSKHALASKDGSDRGPCYRCLFPRAPRPEDVTDCEDGGVLGVVTGLVGTMQAAEALKLIIGLSEADEPTYLTLVAPFSYPPFRTVKLRPRNAAGCRACGDPQLMTDDDRRRRITADLTQEDYTSFCGLINDREEAGPPVPDADPEVVAKALQGPREALVVDVRPAVEFHIANLSTSINIPFRDMMSKPQETYERIASLRQQRSLEGAEPVYVLCRKGNDSRQAQRALTEAQAGTRSTPPITFINVRGGLRAWARDIDPDFPVY